MHAAWRAVEFTFAKLDMSVQAWIEHVRHADSWALRRHMLRPLQLAGRDLRRRPAALAA